MSSSNWPIWKVLSINRILGEKESGKKLLDWREKSKSNTATLCPSKTASGERGSAQCDLETKCEKLQFGENYQSNSKCLLKCISSASNFACLLLLQTASTPPISRILYKNLLSVKGNFFRDILYVSSSICKTRNPPT